MATKKYDELTKLPVDKLSQALSDITYTYNETKVPKQHYKKILNEYIEQNIAQEINLNFLSVYVNALEKIKSDSPKLFFQAMLCIEHGISLKSGIRPYEQQALEVAYMEYESSKDKSFMKEDINSLFNEIIENGLLDKEKEQEEMLENDNEDIDKDDDFFN